MIVALAGVLILLSSGIHQPDKALSQGGECQMLVQNAIAGAVMSRGVLDQMPYFKIFWH